MSSDFSQLGLSPETLETLKDLQYLTMTPIQAESIPLALQGHDLVCRSQTGSGKTAAFALPILHRIQVEILMPQALILCPTRELCEQVVKEIRKFSRRLRGLDVVSLVGGQPYPPQIQALELGAQIVVGTPGRTVEMLKSGRLIANTIKTLVLDEADRMLDEGFSEEVTQIIHSLPVRRQTVFFSATFPEDVELLSKKYQKNPKTVMIQAEAENAPNIQQYVYPAEKTEKVQTLIRILQQHPTESTLIFCRTKDSVNEICDLFSKWKIACRRLHGDLEQKDRDQALALFRNGSLRILVATDIAARGLDIDHLELVVNFDLPSSPDIYLHRIGRTGRAGKSGTAVSIAEGFDAMKIIEIEKTTGQKMLRPKLGFENQHGLGKKFQDSKMRTIFISGGRKDKLRPGDILGALSAAPQALAAGNIGKFDLQDHYSYVAVKSEIADQALQKLKLGKIKGAKFKVYFVEA